MATFRLKFRPSTVRDREGTLFFRIIHGREIRQVGSGCRLRSEEWDDCRSEIVIPDGADDHRRRYLATLMARIADEKARMVAAITRLDGSGRAYTAAQVAELYLSPQYDAEGFVAYARRLIVRLQGEGELKARRYAYCVKSLADYLGEGGDIPLNRMDAAAMLRYEQWLSGKDVCPNSTSHYMRNLRAIYNRAVAEGLTPQNAPFAKVYTGVAKTRKRAIPMADFARIQALDLSEFPSLAYARDVFIFLFLTQGMSFCDMAFLKKSDIKEGILSYRRKKTGQRISVKWQPPMQRIVDRHGNPASPYLLPVITAPDGDTRRQYQNALHLLNHKLKKVGEMAGVRTPLTSYVARHGWASNARNENVPIKTISTALGHENETTTAIYLTQIDTHEVDRANERLIRSFSRETDRQRKMFGTQPKQKKVPDKQESKPKVSDKQAAKKITKPSDRPTPHAGNGLQPHNRKRKRKRKSDRMNSACTINGACRMNSV